VYNIAQLKKHPSLFKNEFKNKYKKNKVMSLLTERLLKATHEENCCCEECKCEKHKENLSEEEIERIINEKYSEKDDKTKEFIRRGLRKFGDRFDYSKTVYTKAQERIIIVCPKHDLEFEQVASEHYRAGRNNNPCPKCASEERTRVMIRRNNEENLHGIRRTLEDFLSEGIKIVGDKLDLSQVTEYKNAVTPVPVICKVCGHLFHVPPNSILRGVASCPKCARERTSEKRRMGFEGFKQKAELAHPDNRYFYDFEENYDLKRNSQKVKIRCNHCRNIFWQEAASHLSGRGCPKCVLSRGEELVENYLKDRGIFVLERENIYGVSSVREYVIPDFRILLESKEIWIEYNGIQHYKATFNFGDKEYAKERLLDQIARDRDVREYCKEHDIFLVEVPYTIIKKDEVYDFLDKVLFEGINPNSLVDYASLFVLENNNST